MIKKSQKSVMGSLVLVAMITLSACGGSRQDQNNAENERAKIENKTAPILDELFGDLGSPYSGSPYSGSPYSGSPYSASPYSASPYSASPYSASPYSGTPYSGSSAKMISEGEVMDVLTAGASGSREWKIVEKKVDGKLVATGDLTINFDASGNMDFAKKGKTEATIKNITLSNLDAINQTLVSGTIEGNAVDKTGDRGSIGMSFYLKSRKTSSELVLVRTSSTGSKTVIKASSLN